MLSLFGTLMCYGDMYHLLIWIGICLNSLGTVGLWYSKLRVLWNCGLMVSQKKLKFELFVSNALVDLMMNCKSFVKKSAWLELGVGVWMISKVLWNALESCCAVYAISERRVTENSVCWSMHSRFRVRSWQHAPLNAMWPSLRNSI